MLALNKVLFLLIVFGQICEIVSGIKRCSDGAYRGYNVPCPQVNLLVLKREKRQLKCDEFSLH